MARWTAVRTVLVVSALVLTGCSSAPTDAPAGPTVAVDHIHGRTEVPVPARRVVVLSHQFADALEVAGVEPVGLATEPAARPNGFPWQTTVPTPATEVALGGDLTPPVERIAALAPDLILAGPNPLDENVYRDLSAIAPTIPALTESYDTPWQDLTALAGRLTGREEATTAAIARTEGLLADWRARHPRAEGATFVLALASAPGQMQVVTAPDDTATAFFAALGMRLDPRLAEVDGTAGVQGVLSPERYGLLADADILLVGRGSPEAAQALEASPLFAQLPQTRDRRYLSVDLPTAYALRGPSVLTGPWLLEQLRPALDTLT